MYSLRVLLTGLMLCGIGLSVGLSSWMSTRDAKTQIEELFDAQMLQTAKMLELFYDYQITPEKAQDLVENPLVLHVEDSRVQTFSQKSDAMKLAYEHKLSFQIWSDSEDVLILSDNSSGQAKAPFRQGYHTQEIDNELWHVFNYYSAKDKVWIITAQQDEVRQELVEQIMGNAFAAPALVVPSVLVLFLLLSYWLFKPIKALERHLSKRTAHDVSPISMPLPSELKPVQNALNVYISRFAKALARERRFSADAAHELKTPLSVIKLHQAGLSDMTTDPDEATWHINAINQGVERLSHTVEQLLLLARVDSIEELTITDCAVESMFNEALNQLMPTITDYEWALELGEGVKVRGDHFYLELVLKNVLENACKYSPKESLITLSATVVGDMVDICVSDQGKGMTDEQLISAKERFYRVNENEGSGAGLGLSICHHIVELHHGELRLGRNAHGGLNVVLTLPKA